MRTIIIMGLLIAAQTCFSQGGKYAVIFQPGIEVPGKIERSNQVVIYAKADSLEYSLVASTDQSEFTLCVRDVRTQKQLAEKSYYPWGSPVEKGVGRLPKNEKELDQFLLDHFGFVVRKIHGKNAVVREV